MDRIVAKQLLHLDKRFSDNATGWTTEKTLVLLPEGATGISLLYNSERS